MRAPNIRRDFFAITKFMGYSLNKVTKQIFGTKNKLVLLFYGQKILLFGTRSRKNFKVVLVR